MKESMNIPENIKLLISGYLSGGLAPEELAVLKTWIGQSQDHKDYFNEIRHSWILSGREEANGEKELLKLIGKMSRIREKPHSFWTWQRVAASWLILIIGAGAMGWQMSRQQYGNAPNSSPQARTMVESKMGSQSMVYLPDGTKVWLNGGSKLTYSNKYDEKERQVELTGEGCFDVVTNPEKPFVVKTGNLAIKALGTVFNVKAYPEDKSVTTTLVKGKVLIEGRDSQDKEFSIYMKPQENIIYLVEEEAKKTQLIHYENPVPATDTNDYLPIIKEDNINTELYTSWKDDLWMIEKQQLGSLAKDFERRYNVQIIFASDAIKDFHFSGTIQRETIEQVMAILARTMPLKYTFNKDVIYIKEDKNLAKEFRLSNQ